MSECPTERVIRWTWRTTDSHTWPPTKDHWAILAGPKSRKRKAHRQIGMWIREYSNQSEYSGSQAACGYQGGQDVPIDIVDMSKVEPCLHCWNVVV